MHTNEFFLQNAYSFDEAIFKVQKILDAESNFPATLRWKFHYINQNIALISKEIRKYNQRRFQNVYMDDEYFEDSLKRMKYTRKYLRKKRREVKRLINNYTN